MEPDLQMCIRDRHGYGPSQKPRLRYSALQSCLEKLAREAMKMGASIHMPRIGTGQAGGAWGLVQQLIDETLCRHGLKVTVYELPDTATTTKLPQPSLFDA